MLKKRGKIARGMIVIGSAFPSIGGFAGGLWTNKSGKKWLAPLVKLAARNGREDWARALATGFVR